MSRNNERQAATCRLQGIPGRPARVVTRPARIRMRAAQALGAPLCVWLCLALCAGAALGGQAVNYTVDIVRRGNYVKTQTVSASIVFTRQDRLGFEEGGGLYGRALVRTGQAVRAGDVLVEITYTRDAVTDTMLSRSLARAQEALRDGSAARQADIQAARTALALETDADARALSALRVSRMERALAQFVLTQTHAVETLEARIAENEARYAVTQLLAPYDGVIDNIALKNEGDTLAARETLVVMHAPTPFLLRVQNDSAAFRYNQPVTVTSGLNNNAVTYTGRVIAADDVLDYALRTGYAYIQLDDDTVVADKLTRLSCQVDAIALSDVLLVKRRALTLDQGNQVAYILEGDMVQRRFVHVSPNRMLEDLIVLQGLAEGQSVLLD